MEIEIKKIVVKDNIRVDYGDLTELAASIKQNGVRQPVELNRKNELIDGYRRLKSAVAAGIVRIPYFYSDEKIDKTTSQLIAGIFQKNLNPVEEGLAYKKYMKENKIDDTDIAVTLGKSKDYVRRRVLIAGLPEEIKKDLISGKIQMGHALILAKMDEQGAKEFHKKITRENLSVGSSKDSLQYNFTKNISNACFDKKDCKGCKYNGSEQAELFETGKSLSGKCMNINCYSKKVKDFVKVKRHEYKKVLFKGESERDDPKGLVDGERSYSCDEQNITPAYKAKLRKEMNPENYLVKVKDDGTITEFFKSNKKLSKGPSDEKTAASNRKDKLEEKVKLFKREFLIETGTKIATPGLVVRAMALWALSDRHGAGESYNKKAITEMFQGSDKDVDSAMAKFVGDIFRSMSFEGVNIAAKHIGVDLKKHFNMTEEFLKLHTKADMMNLAKEFKIEIKHEKNAAIMNEIVRGWKKGQVPKIMGV